MDDIGPLYQKEIIVLRGGAVVCRNLAFRIRAVRHEVAGTAITAPGIDVGDLFTGFDVVILTVLFRIERAFH